jgi:hypothetical protein
MAAQRGSTAMTILPNQSLQATATRLRCEAWAVRTGVQSLCGSRRLVRVAVPEFDR